MSNLWYVFGNTNKQHYDSFHVPLMCCYETEGCTTMGYKRVWKNQGRKFTKLLIFVSNG